MAFKYGLINFMPLGTANVSLTQFHLELLLLSF